MKLDFGLLYGPAPALTLREPWGRVGTVGTRVAARACLSLDGGDSAGTRGDNSATAADDGTATNLDGCPAVPCPQVSPLRPHGPGAAKPCGVSMSPVSPHVPGMADSNAGDEGFDREAFEERAAIMEFDGGMTRADVEMAALAALMGDAPRSFRFFFQSELTNNVRSEA